MHKEIITSLQNDGVKQTIALRDAKARREYGLTVIDGIREISRALSAGISLERVYICPSLYQGRDEEMLVSKLKTQKIKIIEVNEAVFEKVAFGQRLEGVLGVCRIPQRSLIDIKPSGKSLFVIVQALEKPGNIGAILRTCDAAGVDGLLLVDAKTDLFNPNVIRASTGTVFSVPTAVTDSQSVVDFLKRYKIKSCSLFPQSENIYTDVDMTGSVAIVLGSEDQGLTDFWQKNTDDDMKIPMNGKADSLNVSVCAAIVIYEAVRQRGLVPDAPPLRRSAKKF